MDFSQVIWTKADAEILLEYIDTIVDSLYGLDSKSFENVARRMPVEKISSFLLAEIKNMPEEARKDYLRELKERIKNCEIMKITVAVDLGREMIEEIIDKLRKKLKGVILDLDVAPEIVGGAKVSWRGKYWERTLYDKI